MPFQSSLRHADQEAQIAAANNNTVQVRVLYDMLGINTEEAKTGFPQTVALDAKTRTTKVIAGAGALGEIWLQGQRLYFSVPLQVFTIRPTPYHIGWASSNQAAPVGGVVKTDIQTDGWFSTKGAELSRDIEFVIDFVSMPSLGVELPGAGSDNVHTLRSYVTEGKDDAQFNQLLFFHDGALAAVGATIELGTLADPDKIMTAKTITVLVGATAAYSQNVITMATPIVAASEVVMTVTVAAITAGKLKFALRNGNVF